MLVRIKLIENVELAREPDDFFRFVRVGAAGASAKGHSDSPGLDRINDAIVSSDTLSNLNIDDNVVRVVEGSIPVAMRPELEFMSDNEMDFDPAQNQDTPQGVLSCKKYPNLLMKVFGTINDFIMDFFGRSAESGRIPCSSTRQDPQHYSTLSNFTPTSMGGGISYHRNGSPVGTMVRRTNFLTESLDTDL